MCFTALLTLLVLFFVSNPQCSIMPHHAISAESLPASIAESVKAVKGRKELSKEGGAAMYGMVGTIPDKSLVNEFLVNLFSEIYTLAD